MPAAIRDIVKSVLQYLKTNNLSPTPENYKKVFYEQAQVHGFDISDCDRLSTFANKLNQEEILELNEKNIVDIDSLFDYVVEKLREKEQSILSSHKSILSKSTIEKIASLMISSLASVYVDEKLEKDISKLTRLLKNDLTLLNNVDLQDNIEDYILARKKNDKETISSKTEQLNNMTNSLGGYLDETVSFSDDSMCGLDDIMHELSDLKLDKDCTKEQVYFKNKMLEINSKMKSLVGNLTQNLKDEQSEVSELREKVLTLEENLRSAKVESSTDFLTGAYSRREFNKQIKSFNVSYNKNKKDFSIVYVDLDYFKKINDEFGHDAGDSVLKTFSKVLMQKLGDKGSVFRYGGEEFVILFPFLNKDESRDFIEDIKKQISKSKFVYKDATIKVTFSAGVALRSEHRRVDDFVKEADSLLYKAKEAGRDKIL